MTTVRSIERLWNGKLFARMSRQTMEMRSESSPRLIALLSSPLGAAAMALIRLDELGQANTPLARRLLSYLLRAQQLNGSFADPAVTAICIRALLGYAEAGQAAGRAVDHLASLQRADGSWPSIPLADMPGDPFATALILFHLAHTPTFAHSVRLGDAFEWLDGDEFGLDDDTRKLMRRLSRRPTRQLMLMN